MTRVAVIDVGTNSTHLLIAQAARTQGTIQGAAIQRPSDSGFQVLDARKDRTRLGECLDAAGNVTEEGYTRLASTLGHFRRLAASWDVPVVRAYATSALRGAPNGEAVAARLHAEVGVHPQIISGEREGQLTYLGAASRETFGADNLLLDLGGGSLELVRGGPAQAERVLSLPLGSVRLNERFLKGGPPGAPPEAADLSALRAHVTALLTPELAAFMPGPETRVFGSSGTFGTLAAVIAGRATGLSGNGGAPVFTVAALGELLHRLSAMTTRQRAEVPGLDAGRADIVVAGAAVLHTALVLLGAPRVTVSAGALREGMLLEYLQGTSVSSGPAGCQS